jgi:NAD(P)-dependent dehydrogenase (short-subunit alcohol dehydrogenase family)
MITGAGKAVGLGFNMVLRYLEAGDTVIATIRKPCPELDELKTQYGEKLIVLTMDISSTASVQEAADTLSQKLDLLINNAVSVSPDCDKGFFDANLDYIVSPQ